MQTKICSSLIKKSKMCPCLAFQSLESEDPSQSRVEEYQTKNFVGGSFGQSLSFRMVGSSCLAILYGSCEACRQVLKYVHEKRYTMAYNGDTD